MLGATLLFGKSKSRLYIFITLLSFDHTTRSIKWHSALSFLIAVFYSYHSVSIIFSRYIFMKSIIDLTNPMSVSTISKLC